MRKSAGCSLAAAASVIVMWLPKTTLGREDDGRPRPQPTYQSAVDLVAITATVQTKDGSYVTDLAADDFRVFDNGVPQTISFFASDNVPLDIALLIDNSGSMGALLPAVQHAAGILVDALGVNDQVAAVTFGGAIRQRIAPTTDHAQVKNALAHLSTGGATPLYDAAYFALRTLNSRHDRMRRRAIVVLTDGDDTASLMSYEAVLELSREAGIAIYIVSLRTSPPVRLLENSGINIRSAIRLRPRRLGHSTAASSPCPLSFPVAASSCALAVDTSRESSGASRVGNLP